MTAVAFEEALRTIHDRSVEAKEPVEIEPAFAAGSVLAENVISDIEMPAFDRAMMDGFAFHHGDTRGGGPFRVVATVAAGFTGDVRLRKGECVRIMTGAPVPEAADTIVPVEECVEEEELVRFPKIPPLGSHISPRGEDLRVGTVVLREGSLLGAQEIGMIAVVGRRAVRVFPAPSVAYMATGNELVEPGTPLPPGKIRNSNAHMIRSQIELARGRPHYLGIARDEKDDLREGIEAGLKHDMLVLSGSVSRGQYDLVPGLLEEAGVEILFHWVLAKPAQPTLFGMRGETAVFGLPGNPVATLFAFEIYVAPAIRIFMKHPDPGPRRRRGTLTAPVTKKLGKVGLLPCISDWRDGRLCVTPLRTHGAADIFATAGADSIAVVPEEIERLEENDAIDFIQMGRP